MWKKIMFGIIIGIVLLTISTGVIYGAQINPASSATNSSAAFAGNGKGEGKGSNQNGLGDCDGTGGCEGTGGCTNENCTGDCNEGLIRQNGQGNNSGNCISSNCPNLQNGQGNNSGNCISSNCPNLQNGQQQKNSQNSNSSSVGTENKKAESGCIYSQSGKYKHSEQYRENNMFRNAFARFLNFFRSRNNS